jgi:hypothetical protein
LGKDFLQEIAKVREMQGREPINSHVIEGFGPGFPPAPNLAPTSAPAIPSAADSYGPPIEREEAAGLGGFEEWSDEAQQGPPESPLIKLGARTGGLLPGVPVIPALNIPPAPLGEDLWIDKTTANYKMHQIQLTEAEVRTITLVVVKAVKRGMDEEYMRLTGGTRPRRARSDGGTPTPAERSTATSPTTTPPRGRRPRVRQSPQPPQDA